MQQRGHQSGGVHAQLGQNVGNGQRVGDVGITGLPQLAGMPLVSDLVGSLQDRQVGLGIDLPVHRHQRLEHRIGGAALGGHPPGQSGPHPTRRADAGLKSLDRRLGRLESGLESRRSLRGRCNRLRRELVLGHVRHLRPRGYPSQAAQAVHRQRCERRATAQPRKFHHYGRPGHVGATALKQASRRADGAAGC
ncbi:Uncharacterised protein [Mycobacterium tuberculosis]|nr:Uncharacterised protein [Mycobacterium tuberculosis]